MRILHVSDLHLGRDLGGIARRPEQEALVLELAQAARDEAVELVVIAGDVFDTANPPAWAEDAFYALLDALAEGGRRAVVVLAGNHDNAVRLAAAEPLAKRLGIMLVGAKEDVPAAFDGGGGRVRIEPLGPGAALIRNASYSSTIGVGALPFVSEVQLVRRTGATPAEGDDRESYGRALSRLFHDRAALLPPELPRLLAGHLWVSGGKESKSERVYRVGALSDLPASLLPAADYVALGHLHRPQTIGTGPTPIVYAGSPIAYSVSEAGQQKRAVLVTLAPGKPAEIRDLPLASGRPVEEWRANSLAELRVRAGLSGKRPIVSLTLDFGRPPSRAEMEEIQELGPAFLAIDLADGPSAGPLSTAPEGQLAELPDDVLARSFLDDALEGPAPDDLVAELLDLLGEAPTPAIREAA
jgi:exonuclease SbcD